MLFFSSGLLILAKVAIMETVAGGFSARDAGPSLMSPSSSVVADAPVGISSSSSSTPSKSLSSAAGAPNTDGMDEILFPTSASASPSVTPQGKLAWVETVRILMSTTVTFYHGMRFFDGATNWVRVLPHASDHLTFQAMSPVIHRSEEHTSELQSQFHLVCRLLL